MLHCELETGPFPLRGLGFNEQNERYRPGVVCKQKVLDDEEMKQPVRKVALYKIVFYHTQSFLCCQPRTAQQKESTTEQNPQGRGDDRYLGKGEPFNRFLRSLNGH
jgi:hypothetical protein